MTIQIIPVTATPVATAMGRSTAWATTEGATTEGASTGAAALVTPSTAADGSVRSARGICGL